MFLIILAVIFGVAALGVILYGFFFNKSRVQSENKIETSLFRLQ